MLPSSRFVRGVCHVHVSIKTVCLTIVLWLFWAKRCRGVSHTPSTAGKLHIKQPSHYPWNKRKCVGAYRIRPSRRRKSTSNECVMFVVIISFSPTWGRMRYAPTHVRLNFGLTSSWQNRRNGCDDADTGHTKPSKRSWRCWLGSHKTLKTIVTTLTRVTQNRRNGRDDGIVFTFFSKCNRNG